MRTSAGEKTISAMHKRTPKKSGERQPTVAVETRLRRHERDCPQDRRWCVEIAVAFAVIVPTGGLRPPLLCCGANVWRRKTIFAMHKRTPKKSGGRQPAVGVGNTSAVALVLRGRLMATTIGPKCFANR
jgi:hypothetical protein